MAARILCPRVANLATCPRCGRNPANGHPRGNWDDDWREPSLIPAWPQTLCLSAAPSGEEPVDG